MKDAQWQGVQPTLEWCRRRDYFLCRRRGQRPPRGPGSRYSRQEQIEKTDSRGYSVARPDGRRFAQCKRSVRPAGLCALKDHCTIDFVSVLRKRHKARHYERWPSNSARPQAVEMLQCSVSRRVTSGEYFLHVSIAPAAPRASLNLGLVALIEDIPKTRVSKRSERVADPCAPRK